MSGLNGGCTFTKNSWGWSIIVIHQLMRLMHFFQAGS